MKTDRRGRRFIFVRFFDVGNAERLKKELDAINIARFRRTKADANHRRYTKNQRNNRVTKVWRRRGNHQNRMHK